MQLTIVDSEVKRWRSEFLNSSDSKEKRTETNRQALSDEVDCVNDIRRILQVSYNPFGRWHHGLRHSSSSMLGGS